MKPRVRVFIPTRNAGSDFGAVLDAVLAQRGDFDLELKVIDSSSDDGHTQQALKIRDLPFDQLPQERFNHGETRNNAAQPSGADFIAFLSQDAQPVDENWLQALLDPFADAKVCASYSAQQPRQDCHPFQALNLKRHMAEASATQINEPLTKSAFNTLDPVARLNRIHFDNVASMVRRSVLLDSPFPACSFGEDLIWARRQILSGRSIAFCPHSRVLHSHGVTRNEFCYRVEAVHRLLREQTDFLPMAGYLMLLRRILGTAWRFGWAAWANGDDAGFGQRLSRCLQAPYWASLQMLAMYRGSQGTKYQEPR